MTVGATCGAETRHSGGRSGLSSTTIGSTGILSSPAGGVPRLIPCPWVNASTRSG